MPRDLSREVDARVRRRRKMGAMAGRLDGDWYSVECVIRKKEEKPWTPSGFWLVQLN